MVTFKNILKKFVPAFFVLLFYSGSSKAQEIDSLAMKVLDEAIGFIFETGNGALYYETVATDLEDPMSIFTLPAYNVHKGGYWFFDRDKIEMQAAGVKVLSDGKLMSIIDESTQLMYLDSIRTEPFFDVTEIGKEVPSFDEIVDKQFGEGSAEYLGMEDVKGRPCHKVKTRMEKMEDTYVLYWVDRKSKKLVLMAEFSQGLFSVYEIKKVTSAPKNYNYTIVLPDHEIMNFHGLNVVDMRFIRDEIKEPGDSNGSQSVGSFY